MEILWWLGAYLLWAVWAVLSWLLVQLFWLLLWLALPICVAAILCVFATERILGKELVWRWIRKQSLGLANRAWHRTRGALFVVWAVPVRVLNWFVIFALWHAVINLWRTPRWTPWQRAWRCRWGYAGGL
jgi:hypothetical protein